MDNAKETNKPEKKPVSKVQQFYKRAKSFVGGILRPNDADKKEPLNEKNKLKELLERIEWSKKHIDPVLIAEGVQDELYTCIRHLATEGFNDGVVGVRTQNHIALAKFRSEDMYTRYTSSLAEKEKELSAEISSKTKVVDDKVRQLNLLHDYQNYLQHHYKFNERGNTRWEFFLYLGCYLIIFIADIPLAAEMLKSLFDVSLSDKQLSLSTIGQHWNVVLMAVGLAVSTIYIKYCYDEFIGKKYGHAVISKKKFEELFLEEGRMPRGLDDKEKARMLKHDRFVRATKISLLIFTLLTIIVLGVFRGFAWRMTSDETGTVEIPTSLISLTMISITLLFSVVSGVCLSLSLNALNNYTRLKNSKREATELEKTYLDASKDLGVSEGKKAYVDKAVTNTGNGEQWKSKVSDLLISYYNMGFDEGYSDPGFFMPQLDFFDRVVSWREQAIAGKINDYINK